MQYTHASSLPLSWLEPTTITLAVVRDAFQTDILPALEDVARKHWKEPVASSHLPLITRQLRTGLRRGLADLTRLSVTDRTCGRLLEDLPPYWEPPVADSCVAHLPAHQTRAYRWTAALLALHVRNALKDLEARIPYEADMRPLNQGIRNTLYSRLLGNPPVIWRLSEIPRTLVTRIATGLDLAVPAAAG
jgi:hypothetical protein